MDEDKLIELRSSEIFDLLVSIADAGGDYYSNVFYVRMPLADQVFVFEYYAETGINIVQDWFLISTFIHLVSINLKSGEFNIENSLIEKFDMFFRKEDIGKVEGILNGDGPWNFDAIIADYGLPKEYCWIVFETFLELSGKNRYKVIQQIRKKNAELSFKNPKLGPEGYLYIIADAKHYKIGITQDVEARFRNLQTSTSSELKMVYSEKLRDYQSLEKKIHKEFAHKRVKGEWFDLVDADIIAIKALIDSAKP
ncbi:hypothetical protein A0128_08135 [Leptospira tipperaryensis]|uniref:Bacteriophage T5 Orf172 DNA-binding domain-containing protein n=1 Tax=Leptospira tipperaryensis TaxID=2564040 RepID=A0A1D7UW84_9LEPT|nr:GIY-YIG nuclease family protein [Leptospira tipperaryensis]AOP33813.1 hypothetical protein A0128_08135 [Leptospira tipperaryensis]